MRRGISIALTGLFVFSTLIFFLPPLYCQEPSEIIKKGIAEYKQENYEESVAILERARAAEPNSSLAAFFLGMAYKQVMDFEKALVHFNDAVTLTPRIKEALPELISILYKQDNIEEAKKWIAVAEKDSIMPPQIAFLKGLVLQKENKFTDSVVEFEKAKDLDPSLKQAAEFQIALSYVKARKLSHAKERFQAAVIANPDSDLAAYARRYQDLVEERIFVERPLRFTLGLFGQYDSNVVLSPDDSVFSAGITNEYSTVLMPSFRVDYVPVLEGSKLFSAQYSFVSNYHEHNSTTHDMTANTISLTPGYSFGRSALNFNLSYSHFLLHGSRYMENLSYGPLYRYLLNDTNIFEVFAGYGIKNYFQDITPPDFENDRDCEGINAYLSWVWLLSRNAFFNLKYEFIDENADGLRYENNGHRLSANAIIPLLTNLKLQLSASYYRQQYRYRLNYPEFIAGALVYVPKERRDKNLSSTIGLTWEVNRNVNVIVQYSRTRNDSNDETSEYTRHLYTAGVEFKF